MLSFIVLFAIVVPLMIWALSPGAPSKRRPRHTDQPAPADGMFVPPSAGAGDFHVGSSCDAGGGGGCDGGS